MDNQPSSDAAKMTADMQRYRGQPPTSAVQMPEQVQTPGVAAVAGWFGAVSIVLTMHKENGRLNIWNELSQVRASTRDAAIGFAVREALKRNPEHQVHCLTATEFSPPNAEVTGAKRPVE